MKNSTLVKTLKRTLFISLLGLILIGCSTEPRPLQAGKDMCHFCKMTLTDMKFASELVTDKGKIYAFDDISCMVGFINQNEANQTKYAHILVADYTDAQALIDVKTAWFLGSPALRSPMQGNLAAFTTEAAAKEIKASKEGELKKWGSLVGKMRK